MKFRTRPSTVVVRPVILAGLSLLLAACSAGATASSNPATGKPAAPVPIAQVAVRSGADTVGTLALYRNPGSQTVEAQVKATANQDVVGVLVITCTPAGTGPDQPAMCDSSADSPSGQLAMHQLGTAHAELTEPMGGCVIARAWIGHGNRTAEATLTLPYANRPARAHCP
jgi:hypothetical protein